MSFSVQEDIYIDIDGDGRHYETVDESMVLKSYEDCLKLLNGNRVIKRLKLLNPSFLYLLTRDELNNDISIFFMFGQVGIDEAIQFKCGLSHLTSKLIEYLRPISIEETPFKNYIFFDKWDKSEAMMMLNLRTASHLIKCKSTVDYLAEANSYLSMLSHDLPEPSLFSLLQTTVMHSQINRRNFSPDFEMHFNRLNDAIKMTPVEWVCWAENKELHIPWLEYALDNFPTFKAAYESQRLSISATTIDEAGIKENTIDAPTKRIKAFQDWLKKQEIEPPFDAQTITKDELWQALKSEYPNLFRSSKDNTITSYLRAFSKTTPPLLVNEFKRNNS